MSRTRIIDRLEAALEKVRAQGMEVRSINLTEEDWDGLNRALSDEYGSTLYTFQFQGHEIRSAKHSTIWSTHGVGVAVPKRLSKRVAA